MILRALGVSADTPLEHDLNKLFKRPGLFVQRVLNNSFSTPRDPKIPQENHGGIGAAVAL
ncbi:MAG: hypothetical protein IPK82_07540 [Polyangiaceae bacterium]|nr:hypothetical protein [Polyangiaceae bacterium]